VHANSNCGMLLCLAQRPLPMLLEAGSCGIGSRRAGCWHGSHFLPQHATRGWRVRSPAPLLQALNWRLCLACPAACRTPGACQRGPCKLPTTTHPPNAPSSTGGRAGERARCWLAGWLVFRSQRVGSQRVGSQRVGSQRVGCTYRSSPLGWSMPGLQRSHIVDGVHHHGWAAEVTPPTVPRNKHSCALLIPA